MTCRSSTPGRRLLSSLAIVFVLTSVVFPSLVSAAEGDVVGCTLAMNVSRTEGFASADPFLLADPAGLVHLFWAERVSGAANAVPNVPDAVMYAVWNGETWSAPIDIFLSPSEIFNRRINGMRAVIDEDRIIHLLWQGPDNTLFYSNAPADRAGLAYAWQPPLLLASDETGAQFSAFLAYEPPSTLHVLYGQGTSNNENRSVIYVRSTDAGQNWSEPAALSRMAATERGASNVRLLFNPPSDLYATWTEWDLSGNGQGVYFARSGDSGLSWNAPVLLDAREGGEYERDWTTLAVLGEDTLVAFWEGGWRAYRQAQYSYDGGATWTEPIDTLDWLIADNGFAEFARDSADRLHLFVFQRVREGNPDKGDISGLWHTTWDGGTTWREPMLVGEQTPGNLVSVAISGGNQLFAASTSTADYQIWVRQCTIEGAPAVSPQAVMPVEIAAAEPTAIAGDSAVEPAAVGTAAAPTPAFNMAPVSSATAPADPLLLGVVGPLLLVAVTTLFYLYRRR